MLTDISKIAEQKNEMGLNLKQSLNAFIVNMTNVHIEMSFRNIDKMVVIWTDEKLYYRDRKAVEYDC